MFEHGRGRGHGDRELEGGLEARRRERGGLDREVDARRPDDRDGDLLLANRINKNLVERAITMGGTSTGEHGVGQGKMAYMAQEHGAALDVMRTLKRALDPKNIMNPGKILNIWRAAKPPYDRPKRWWIMHWRWRRR